MNISSDHLVLSVIMPIHNEEKVLQYNCERFTKEIDAVVGRGKWQYVFVENGSTDNSINIINNLIQKRTESCVVQLPQGDYGNALREGIFNSSGGWCFIMNVDHEWDMPFFNWAWQARERYDMILGSKRADPTLNGQDQYRRVLTASLNALLQYFFDFVGADSHGMKLMRTVVAKELAEECVMRRGQFDTELTLRALRGAKWVAEGPLPYRENRPPRNLMVRKIINNVLDLIRMVRVMKGVPYKGSVCYHRYCRYDLMHAEKCLSASAPMALKEVDIALNEA